MKIVVKLAVLITTLLLVTGIAFAGPGGSCYCYDINATSLDFPGETGTSSIIICFDYDNEGSVYGMCSPPWTSGDPLYMFFDPYKKEAITYADSYGICTVYFKFHGDNNHVVQGLFYFNIEGRWEFRGHQVDMENCDFTPPP
jgi:hypothetical protein